MTDEDDLTIIIDGPFAGQVRRAARHLEVEPRALVKMALVPFLSSPLVAGQQRSSAQQPTTPTEFHSDEVDGSDYMGRDQSTDIFAGLRKSDIDFSSLELGKSVGKEDKYILWGQFSRFLPIKFTLRVLARIGQGGPISLEDWFAEVKKLAPAAREKLRGIDVNLKIRRGVQLASGFPQETEKSNDRFISHFCASEYADGRVVGMPSHLGFIEVADGFVGLTPDGLAYVEADNPIIDGTDGITRSMGAEEVRLMSSRIQSHLPKEWKFQRNILDWIKEGKDTPDELTSAISRVYGPGTGRDWNERQVPTYRTGAIGRLGELGHIQSQWAFRRVTYIISNSGEEVLSEALQQR